MKPDPCRGCPLYEKGSGPVYPQMPSSPEPFLVVIGEAPGEHEVLEGVPFVGPSGRRLRRMLQAAGVRSSHCLITNTVWCRPPGNQTPDEETVNFCTQRYLFPLLKDYNNYDWLLVGTTASQTILEERITACQGYVFENAYGTGCIYPILHPQALSHNPEAIPSTQAFIARAARHERPIKQPDYILNPHIYDLVAFVAAARSGKLIVFDVETVGITDMTLRSIAITSHTGQTMSTVWSGAVMNAVRPLFEDAHVTKAAYHVRFDVHALRLAGIEVNGDWMDIIRLVQLDNRTSGKLSLEAVAPVYLAIPPWKQQQSKEGLLLYNARDSFYEWSILNDIMTRMFGTPRYELYNRTKNLEKAVYGMEQRGIMIDVPRLQATRAAVLKELDELREVWDNLTGGVNPQSPKQVREFLKSKGIKFWHKNDGSESTDQRYLTLMALRDPVAAKYINPLLRLRYLNKMQSTYLQAFVPSSDGLLRTSIRITGAHTGRFSFASPNLGNIPKNKDEFGLRKLFVARPGYLIMSSDWSQAETRITAILANETQMLDAWAAGRDVHRLTASRLYNIKEAAVTKEQRELAKRIVYGLSYGAGAVKISEVTNIPSREVKVFISRFKAAFPAYFNRLQEWSDMAAERGYLVNPFGRMLTFEGTNIAPKARNFIPQSTVADMMNIVLCDIYAGLKGKRSALILQIYDQVLVEVAEDEIDYVKELVHSTMNRRWPELGNHVIPADVSVGVSWGDV